MQVCRDDSKEEHTIKDASNSRFNNVFALKGERSLVLSRNKEKTAYFAPSPMVKMLNIILKKMEPEFVGSKYADTADGINFSFGTIYKYAKQSDYHKVIISRKEEMRFLYGKDIKSGQMRKYDQSLKIGDEAIICNKSDEALGLGKVIADLKKAKRQDVVIKNIIDIGLFIRRKE